ncbi:hypothetical protein SAMD00019534_067940, partial [Acytostelium subglobosum LB1]|uniref:hypothetical protein n=1 Tax=Acytostelium subglobosum LB1 TaxID=1410327 RepID=UPI0006452343
MLDRQRGTWMFFAEGLAYIPTLIIVLYHVYIEVFKKNLNVSIKHMYLKSIPFLVFFVMTWACIARICCGFTALYYDSDATHRDRVTMGFYSWAIQFMCIEYYFIGLLWIKLVLVFQSKSGNVEMGRAKLIDWIVYVAIIISFIFYTAFVIAEGIIGISHDNRIRWDHTWRGFFLTVVALIVSVLFLFGSKLLYRLSKSNNGLDELLKSKIKAIMFTVGFIGSSAWVLNVCYMKLGIEKPPQDWINLGIFFLEMINMYSVIGTLGRSQTATLIRLKLGLPEMIDTDSSGSNNPSQKSNGVESSKLKSLEMSQMSQTTSQSIEVYGSSVENEDVNAHHSSV